MKKIIVIGLISLLIITMLFFGCTQEKKTGTTTGTTDDVINIKDSTTAQKALVETSDSVDNVAKALSDITEDLTK